MIEVKDKVYAERKTYKIPQDYMFMYGGNYTYETSQKISKTVPVLVGAPIKNFMKIGLIANIKNESKDLNKQNK